LQSDKYLKYFYTFEFQNRDSIEYSVLLDAKTLEFVSSPPELYPKWTLLENNKCSVCDLDETHKYCPAAVSIISLLEYFKDSISYEQVEVTVDVGTRKYVKSTSLQDGLSSLTGLLMVASGCPIMKILRPMARFHLPFATIDETEYRAASMYLFSQFFVMENDGEPDWELKKLYNAYGAIVKLNKSFANRLRSVVEQDANVNALIILDIFANTMKASDGGKFEGVKHLFNGTF